MERWKWEKDSTIIKNYSKNEKKKWCKYQILKNSFFHIRAAVLNIVCVTSPEIAEVLSKL